MAVAESDVPIAMKKVYRRLERWRAKREGRARIPDSIWRAAGALAREHGVNPVSQALHLEFNHLKRVAESSRPIERNKRLRAPSFVELIAPQSGAPQCLFELEGRRGKLRIEFKAAAAADLASLSRALWEMIS